MRRDTHTERTTRRHASLLIALVVAAVTAVSGCGSGSSDPAAVVRQFYSALGNGDGDTVCSLLTPDARQRYIRGSGSCVQNVRFVGPLAKRQLRNLLIGNATVHGSTATVPYILPYKQGVITLRQNGGRWVITTVSNP